MVAIYWFLITLWTTKRYFPLSLFTGLIFMLFDNINLWNSSWLNSGSLKQNETMLIFIDYLSILISSISLSLFAKSKAVTLSLWIYPTKCYNAYRPAAAIKPVCFIPPPKPFLMLRALSISSSDPMMTDPTGQQSPFDKHIVIESKHFPIYFGSHL